MIQAMINAMKKYKQAVIIGKKWNHHFARLWGDTIHSCPVRQSLELAQMVALSRVYSGGKKNTPKRGNASALGWEGEHASSSDDTLAVLCPSQPCDFEKVALCGVLNPKQNSDTLKAHSTVCHLRFSNRQHSEQC